MLIYTTSTAVVTLLTALTSSLLFALLDLAIAAAVEGVPGLYTKIKALSNSHEYLKISLGEYRLWRFRREYAQQQRLLHLQQEHGTVESGGHATTSEQPDASAIYDHPGEHIEMDDMHNMCTLNSRDKGRLIESSDEEMEDDETDTVGATSSAGTNKRTTMGKKPKSPSGTPRSPSPSPHAPKITMAPPPYRRRLRRSRALDVLENVTTVVLSLALAYAVVEFSWVLGYASTVVSHISRTQMSTAEVGNVPLGGEKLFTGAGVLGLDYNTSTVSGTDWTPAGTGLFLFNEINPDGYVAASFLNPTIGNFTCGYVEEIVYATYLSTNLQQSVSLAGGNFTTFRLLCMPTDEYGEESLDFFRVTSTGVNHTYVEDFVGVGNTVVSIEDAQSSMVFVNNNGTTTPRYMTNVTRTETFYDSMYDAYTDFIYDLTDDTDTTFLFMEVVAATQYTENGNMTIVTNQADFINMTEVYNYIDFVLVKEVALANDMTNRTLACCRSDDTICYVSSTVYNMYEERTADWTYGPVRSNLKADLYTSVEYKGYIPLAYSTVFTGKALDVEVALAAFKMIVNPDGADIRLTQDLTHVVISIGPLLFTFIISLAVYTVVFLLVWALNLEFGQRAAAYHMYTQLAKSRSTQMHSILTIDHDINGGVFRTPRGQVFGTRMQTPERRINYAAGLVDKSSSGI
ncbi:uncharacterized protein V1518DRAFT_417442 [Limtongia smithiae]|uniref:uncharacterized protein n=1 Tax=Limtongia smithiae TaxID=1125753 RepID=UPI0034CE901E